MLLDRLTGHLVCQDSEAGLRLLWMRNGGKTFGPFPQAPAIVVANHSSHMDSMLLGLVIRWEIGIE